MKRRRRVQSNQPLMQTSTIPDPTQPTSSLNRLIIKKYATKIISISLLVSGLKDIGVSLYEIFRYSNAIQAGLTITPMEFQELLKTFLVEGTEAIVETVYGMALLLKPIEKIKILHILIGAAIFLLPFLINDQLLQRVEAVIPQVIRPTHLALAQETSPNQALSDYQFQLQKYREAHQNYLSTKNAFLTFQTLNSRTEAINQTKALLHQRAEALKSYLFALRITLLNTPAISSSKSSQLAGELSAAEKNLKGLQDKIPSINSLEEISQNSLEFETSFPQTQLLAYQTLFAILSGEQDSAASGLTKQSDLLKSFASQADQNELNLSQINQWLTDTESTLEQNQATSTDAEELLTKIRPTKSSRLTNQRNFAKILNLFDASRERLITITSFLQETLKLIRYG